MTSAILIPILGEKIALDCILLADDFYFTVCIANWKLCRNKKDMTVRVFEICEFSISLRPAVKALH